MLARSSVGVSAPTWRPRRVPSAPMNTVVGRAATPSLAAVQAQEAHLVLGLEVDLLEPGHLFAAGAAPGCPDVEHQRPPAEVIRQVEPGPGGEAGHLEMDGVGRDPGWGRGSVLAAGLPGAGWRAGGQ